MFPLHLLGLRVNYSNSELSLHVSRGTGTVVFIDHTRENLSARDGLAADHMINTGVQRGALYWKISGHVNLLEDREIFGRFKVLEALDGIRFEQFVVIWCSLSFRIWTASGIFFFRLFLFTPRWVIVLFIRILASLRMLFSGKLSRRLCLSKQRYGGKNRNLRGIDTPRCLEEISVGSKGRWLPFQTLPGCRCRRDTKFKTTLLRNCLLIISLDQFGILWVVKQAPGFLVHILGETFLFKTWLWLRNLL